MFRKYLLLADTRSPFNRDLKSYFIYEGNEDGVYLVNWSAKKKLGFTDYITDKTEWGSLEELAHFATGNGWNYNVARIFNSLDELPSIVEREKVLMELVN